MRHYQTLLTEKGQYLQTICKRQQNILIKGKENKYQLQAIKAIQQQQKICGFLTIITVVQKIFGIKKRNVFKVLREIEVQKVDKKQNRMRNLIFVKKLQFFFEAVNFRFIMQSFKKVNRKAIITQKFQTIQQISIKLSKIKVIQLLKNSYASPQKSRKCLSGLDISLIHPKRSQFIISTVDIGHVSEDSTLQIEQIKQIQKRLIEKETQIHNFRLQKQKQMSVLKKKIDDLEHKSMVYSEFTINSKQKFSEIGSNLDKTKTNMQDIVLAKFIRKNFELQEKLEEVYQILSVVSPDLTTEFGKKLASICTKKPYKQNAQLFQQI